MRVCGFQRVFDRICEFYTGYSRTRGERREDREQKLLIYFIFASIKNILLYFIRLFSTSDEKLD